MLHAASHRSCRSSSKRASSLSDLAHLPPVISRATAAQAPLTHFAMRLAQERHSKSVARVKIAAKSPLPQGARGYLTLPRTPTTRLSRNGGGTRPGHTAEEKRYARAEQKRAGEEEERPGEIAIGLLEHANDGRTGEPAEIADRVDEGEACCGAGSGEGGSPCGRRLWRKPGEWDRTSDGRSSFARPRHRCERLRPGRTPARSSQRNPAPSLASGAAADRGGGRQLSHEHSSSCRALIPPSSRRSAGEARRSRASAAFGPWWWRSPLPF